MEFHRLNNNDLLSLLEVNSINEPKNTEDCDCPQDCDKISFTQTLTIDTLDDAVCWSRSKPKQGT